MATKTKRRRVVATTSCKYCEEEIPKTRGAMGGHISTACPMAPVKEDPDLEPGTVLNEGTGAPYKVPWSWSNIERKFPRSGWPTFVARMTHPCTFNGLKVELVEGEQYTLPSCFMDIDLNSWLEGRDISRWRQPGDVVVRVVGSGPLEP